MIKRIILFLLLAFSYSTVSAGLFDYQEFSKMVDRVENTFNLASRKNFVLDEQAEEGLLQIANITEIKSDRQKFALNLSWIRQVVEQVKAESDMKKRQLIYTNLIDTLTGFRTELTYESIQEGATRKEMEDALERAMKRTMPLILARGASVDESIEWSGSGGCVMEGHGDGISVINAQSADGRFRGTSSSGGSGSSAGGGNSKITYNSSSNTGLPTGADSGFSSQRNFSKSNFSNGSSATSNPSINRSRSNSGTMRTTKTTNSVPSGTSYKPHTVSAKPKPQQPSPPPKKTPPPPKPKPGSQSNLLYWLMGIVFVIGLLTLLFFVYKKLQDKILNEERDLEKVESHLPAERMKTESIYEQALEAASKGDYQEAIRLLTIGSLLLLEKQQIVDFKDSFTNGEYLRELLAERQRHELFKKPLALFDRIVYGFAKTDKSDYEMFKNFYLELEKLEI